jgi:hypothetical protein
MANLVCPTYGKDYVLPTKAWLEPLEMLASQDVSTHGKIIISEMLKEFLNRVRGLPNLVNTYCVFSVKMIFY